jgi:hypothetical protein
MRYFMGTVLVLALLGGPAYSQNNNQDWGPNEKDVARKAEEDRRAKDIERQYYEVTKRTAPTAKVSSDPWQSVRPSASTEKSR